MAALCECSHTFIYSKQFGEALELHLLLLEIGIFAHWRRL